LEHWGDDIDQIIFVVASESDLKLYTKILPFYFPRDESEELIAKSELPRDIGNEFGETVIEERKIRITNSDFGNVSVLENVDEKPLISFTEMHNNPDLKRKKVSKTTNQNNEQNENLYFRLLRQAQTIDLSDIARLQIIYQSGVDSQGRPIVIFIGSRLPEKRAHLDRVFLYIIKMMDKIVDNDYVVVYIHTFMENKSKPEFNWLEQIYNQIDIRYNTHLRALYIMHPTFWLKIVKGFFSTLSGNTDFWNKLVYIERLADLFDIIDPNQLVIPEDVLEYDEKTNGPIHNIRLTNRSQTNAESLLNNL